MEKWKYYVEIIKVAVDEVLHKVNLRKLKLHGGELEYRRHPLQGSSVMSIQKTTRLTSGTSQNFFLRFGMKRAPVRLYLSLTNWLVSTITLLLP